MKSNNCNLCEGNNEKFLMRKNGFKIVRCNNCGLVYVNPIPKDKEIKVIYSYNNYFKEYSSKHEDYVASVKIKEKNYRKILSSVRVFKKTGKLLEVGCATGFLLELAKKYSWNAYGVEISKYASAIGKKKGLNIFTGTIENCNFPDNEFDVVVMINTLEHTTNPKRTLKTIYQKLRVGGILIVVVPNFDCLQRMKEVKPPKHLFYFIPETLSKMLEEVGFKIQTIQTNDYVRAVFSQMVKRFNRNIHQRLSTPMNTTQNNKEKESKIFKITSYISNKLRLGESIEIRVEK